MEWLFANWEYIILGLLVAEKIVKLTPWPYDDIVLDMILKPVFNALAPKKNK